MKTKLTLLLLLITICSCTNAQQNQKVNFNFKEYATPSTLISQRDSTLAFTNLILDNKLGEAKKLYPEMFKIDVTPHMNEGPGYKPYLGSVGEFALDYSDTDSIMALAVFLKNNYNAHNNVYDMLLRVSLTMDSTNVAAMFLLAKLRYENNITDDAYFLVKQMMKLEPENKKVKELNNWFENSHVPLGNNLPSLDQFLDEKVFYRDF